MAQQGTQDLSQYHMVEDDKRSGETSEEEEGILSEGRVQSKQLHGGGVF